MKITLKNVHRLRELSPAQQYMLGEAIGAAVLQQGPIFRAIVKRIPLPFFRVDRYVFKAEDLINSYLSAAIDIYDLSVSLYRQELDLKKEYERLSRGEKFDERVTGVNSRLNEARELALKVIGSVKAKKFEEHVDPDDADKARRVLKTKQRGEVKTGYEEHDYSAEELSKRRDELRKQLVDVCKRIGAEVSEKEIDEALKRERPAKKGRPPNEVINEWNQILEQWINNPDSCPLIKKKAESPPSEEHPPREEPPPPPEEPPPPPEEGPLPREMRPAYEGLSPAPPPPPEPLPISGARIRPLLGIAKFRRLKRRYGS